MTRNSTLVLTAIVLAGSVTLLGQDLPASKVPVAVQQAFHAKFPTVKQVAWKLKAPTYDAESQANKPKVRQRRPVSWGLLVRRSRNQ